MTCSACPDRQAPAAAHPRVDDGGPSHADLTAISRAPHAAEWVSTARLAADAVLLAALLPPDVAGIAGVPRSGMVPAAVVATHLHLPLYELQPSGPRLMMAGSRHATLARGPGRLAVVDDTVYAGGAMRWARAALRGAAAVFAAVYCRPEARAAVDVAARDLPSPHLLEWNLLNNAGVMAGNAHDRDFFRGGVGLDLDGVIVHDGASGGPPGAPHLVPRAFPVPLIATGRHERHRGVTEALLRALGVRWARLEMLSDDTHPHPELIADHKAKHFRAAGLGLFVESDPEQAEMIHRLTGLPVACPAAARVFRRPVA